MKIQLKATILGGEAKRGVIPYRLNASTYDVLRHNSPGVNRLLVVLFLPRNFEEWVNHSPTELALKRCAYWFGLTGAPAITADSKAIFIPEAQTFNSLALKNIVSRIAASNAPTFERQ